MAGISIFRSSSTHLAIIFSALIAASLILFFHELKTYLGHDNDMRTMSLYLIIAVLCSVVLGLFGISYYVTKRINTIIRTADTIVKTGDLSARIPLDNRWDDLSTLAATLNTMIGRIEESVESIRTVSDNIAHDLRTPLTRMRNRIERLSIQPCDAHRTGEEMQYLLEECDQLLATFQALLRISRVEHSLRKDKFISVSLDALLADVIDLYEPLASEKQIVITSNLQPYTVQADSDLLFQCFANILDNAIKYTPANGIISINVTPHSQRALISITDSGTGITEEAKKKVFTRFFRSDETRNSSGNGLGLALVAAIIKMHHGQITLHDNKPSGLEVRVMI